jgi:uncharacterized repeat protein (TIGR01451 family)
MTMRPDPEARRTAASRASSPEADRRHLRARGVLFVVVCLVCVLATVVYVRKAVTRAHSRQPLQEQSPAAEAGTDSPLARTSGPLILFSNLAAGGSLGYRAALAPIVAPDRHRAVTGLACEQVYFAGGHGLCLGDAGSIAPWEGAVTSTHAYVFGPDFRIIHDILLGGVPSRARVSADGRHGAVTVFVAGHSYADASFSTATTLLDLDSGNPVGNLETFAVWREGRRFQSLDFNFWGVTFAPDSDRFYATLGSSGRTFLVEGSIAGRRMQVLRENFECPSASPDGTRLAYKRRVGARDFSWRLHVLDLATMTDTALAESRSIDDQIEWLDERRVLYGEGDAIWVAEADGTGTPRKFLSQARSPVVLRGDPLAGALASVATTDLTLPVADLAITIRSSVSSIAVGGQVKYTVTVTNEGPADATMLMVDQLLGPGLTAVGVPSATNPGQGYGCSSHDDPGHLSCDTPALPRGSVWTMTFTARASATGTQTVHVIANGAEADSDSHNDQAVARTTVHP